jgi:hypothetical protein
MSLVIYKIFCVDESITDTYIDITPNLPDMSISWSGCSSYTDNYFVPYHLRRKCIEDYVNFTGGWKKWDVEKLKEVNEDIDKIELRDIYNKLLEEHKPTLNR